MPSVIPQQRTVDALRAVWESIGDLASTLEDHQWEIPSPLPGWDVRANVAHIVGTEEFLLGQSPTVEVDAEAVDHVRNPIGALNENWVASHAGDSPAELLDRFRAVTAARLEILESMPAEEWNRVGFTPAGEDVYGRFMRIRVFDCWMHEQDIRVALRSPGHESGPAVEVSLDEMAAAMGFVVGKRAGAPDGSSVTFDLTGGTSRRIHVRVDGRATVVTELTDPATTTLTMPVITFSRYAGGRADAAEQAEMITISGDRDLGERVLAGLAYTI